MKRFRKRRPPVGARPGTLALDPSTSAPTIHLLEYGPDRFEQRSVTTAAELPTAVAEGEVMWIDVQALDETLLRALGARFGLHPLLLEDIAHVPQRPKSDTYDQHEFLVTRMVRLGDDDLDVEQVSIVLGDRYVITFQERAGDVLDPVRERLRVGKGPIRRAGAAYLAYALLDTIIDAYYPVIEGLGDLLERYEDRALQDPSPAILGDLHRVRDHLLRLRRSLWPQRDAISKLVRGDAPLFEEGVRLYLRDTYDHCSQMAEITESYRELVSGLMSTHLAVVSNRMNEIMKVLTLMASIFIPLTFMAGIYGMNFDSMPELHMPWFYPALWIAMGLVAGGMVYYFKRRGWFDS